MKKIFILYATKEGQTEKVARVIEMRMKKDEVDVMLQNADDLPADESPNLDDYDLLVFGASLHEGKIEKVVRRFINQNADQIRGKPRSFFLLSLSAAEKDVELRQKWLADARQGLDKQLDVEFTEVEMIAGALKYTEYSWLMKKLMQHVSEKAGGDTDVSRDYEYTDWDQVIAYAHRLAGQGANKGLQVQEKS